MSLPAHVYRRDAGRPGPHGVGPGVLMPLAFLVLASWVSALATDAGTSPSGTPDEPPPRAPTAPATDWTGSEWPTISLSLQDSYHGTDLTRLGVVNDAWCLSQYALGSPRQAFGHGEESDLEKQANIQQFIDLPTTAIRASLGKYAAKHPQLTRGTTNTIIIDIEAPVHPRHLWKLLGGENHDQITPVFSGVVQAFARRYAVVRDTYPHAKLTAYGLGSPDSQGRDREDVEQPRLRAEILAVKMGMLESVDAISPVIYERFSPADQAFRHRERATVQGLRNALEIVKASDRPLDIIVLLSLVIFNGNSDATKKAADLVGLADRLDHLARLGVRRVIIWNGNEMLAQTGISVTERITQLRAVERSRAQEAGKSDPPPDKPPGAPLETP